MTGRTPDRARAVAAAREAPRPTPAVWLVPLATLLAALSVVAGVRAAASAGAATPSGSRNCGLFHSAVTWTDSEHIKGYFYAYGVVHLTCPCGAGSPRGCHEPVPAMNGYVIAELALLGKAHPYGFTCTVSRPVDSGYCVKGTTKANAVGVSWAPETDCAIPDPPYTPATMPAMCKS